MRKEYIKPSLEVILLDAESPMALSQELSGGKGQEEVDFGSRHKRQWDDEETWDDFEDEADY